MTSVYESRRTGWLFQTQLVFGPMLLRGRSAWPLDNFCPQAGRPPECDLNHFRWTANARTISFMNFDSSAFVAQPSLLRKLLERALPLDCAKGRVLFRQGDRPYGLFILRRGDAIMTLESERGAVLLQTQIVPGSLLGLPALLSGNTYTMSTVAKRRAEVSYVTRKDFSTLMLAEPKLALEALRVLAAEVHIARAAIVQCPQTLSHDSVAQPEHRTPGLASPTAN